MVRRARVQALSRIDGYSHIEPGERGMIINRTPFFLTILWDRNYTMVIATDDLDTLSRLEYCAAGYHGAAYCPQAEGLHGCEAATG